MGIHNDFVSRSSFHVASERRRLELQNQSVTTTSTTATDAAKAADAARSTAASEAAGDATDAARTPATAETVDGSRSRARGAEDAIRARLFGDAGDPPTAGVRRGLGDLIAGGRPKPPRPPPRPTGSTTTVQNDIVGDDGPHFA